MDNILQTNKAKVVKLVKVLANCSSSDAAKAADKICKDPEAIILLSLACGFTTTQAVNGTKAAVANAAVQAWPFAIAAGVYAGANALGAKRFCTAVVRQTGEKISAFEKESLRNFSK